MEYYENRDIKNLPNEIWRAIKNYKGLYEISSYGRVKSLKRKTKTNIIKKDMILKINKRHTGYVQAKLCKNSKIYNPVVGRLVAEAFLDKPDYACVANHKDCVRHNNTVSNLEWITQSQNTRYAYLMGNKSQKGEKNNMAKLTLKKVKEIREFKKKNDHLSQQKIADHFSLKRENVKDIINYKTWNY